MLFCRCGPIPSFQFCLYGLIFYFQLLSANLRCSQTLSSESRPWLLVPTGRWSRAWLSGRSVNEVDDLKQQLQPDTSRRDYILRRTLEDGAAWEPRTHNLLQAWERKNTKPEKLKAIKKAKAKNTRLGATMVKKFEKIKGHGEALMGEEATLFRAIAARANYLALDRPDIGFATKELCRGFANPDRADDVKLKRLGEYHEGKKGYVWKFAFDGRQPK